jgi:hypothetical protein
LTLKTTRWLGSELIVDFCYAPRDGKTFVPTANTELVAEDTLLVLAEPKGAADLRATCLGIHV